MKGYLILSVYLTDKKRLQELKVKEAFYEK